MNMVNHVAMWLNLDAGSRQSMLLCRARSEAHFQAASGTVDRHAVTLSELLKGSSHARHPIGEEVVGSPSTYANLILKGVIWGVNVGASVHAY